MKAFLNISLVVLSLMLFSCADNDEPNYQYMPNMYVSVPYDTYGKYEVFPDNYEAMQPAQGSVSRGWLPYDYEDSNEGYASAKANLMNPVPLTEENYETGKELYEIYCGICHGSKGAGQGYLVEQEKILGVPSYDDAGRAITPGSIYHVLYYGINTMGSYASQTTEEERWQIIHYVMSLKTQLEGGSAPDFENMETATDSTQTAMEMNTEMAMTETPEEN
ncbi:c-type cytochrome [Croceiramulus getboli]|nr:c-type cytochrome [Flavobacteriaceae bacterium YJPT1-3]